MSVIALLSAAALAASEVTIPGPKGPLAATLIDRAKDAPVVLLIPGSGPTDRNGDNPAGVSGGVYRQLSDQLAARGIASLRIDKRGMFGSKSAIPDANAVTIADYVADVRGWTRFLQARGKRCVWLAGHSEGGIVALAAAQQPKGTCGLILLAAPGRPLGTVLRAQLKPQLPADMFASAEAAIARLERRQRVDPASVPAPLAPLFNPAVQPYLMDLMAHDPAALAAKSKLPMLIVQGETDIQVKVEDARLLAAARPGARLVLVSGINHLWRKAPADPAANAATYRDSSIPVDPAVANAIAAFVNAKR
ncbi:MAG: alpha/beta hydrolase [Sphingomicrobium sp.]